MDGETHERKFPCTSCDFKAKRKAHLMTHTKSVHEGLRFPCEICLKSYSTNHALKVHTNFSHMNIT